MSSHTLRPHEKNCEQYCV